MKGQDAAELLQKVVKNCVFLEICSRDRFFFFSGSVLSGDENYWRSIFEVKRIH